MANNDKSSNVDIKKGGQDSNVERGVRIELNESYIPDFQFTPPTPMTPPPPTVDTSSKPQSTGNSGE